MPFDSIAVARQCRAAILHGNPVNMRVPAKGENPPGVIFIADFKSANGKATPMDGGIFYDRGGTLVVAKVDFPDGIIEDTFLEMQISPTPANPNGALTWKQYKVENLSGTEQPIFPEVSMVIVPRGK